MKLHFFIPYQDDNNLDMIHWRINSLEEIKEAISSRKDSIFKEDRIIRVMNIENMAATDVWLSNLERCRNNDDFLLELEEII